jgi:hypothetical protein
MGGKPKLVLEQGPSSLGPLRKRLSARLSDLYVRYFDRASADNHALAVCGREPVAHKVDHLCNREAMRTHDRLGTAIAPGGKQFKRASAKVCRAARSYRDRSRHQASGAALILFLKGLRGIEWVIFEVKAREKRGLRRDSAFRGMGYLA